MMDVITYQKTYREYKAELDSELQKTAEGFVRIGYLLKVARDTDVLAESGYKTVAQFAQAEYSLDKTQVSRFISINDKFSEGGYSDRLRANYQGFGYAKLTLMLQLPDAVNEVLTPQYSKSEIQGIKDEIDEEKKISDIEVCLEGASVPVDEGTLTERITKKLLHDEPAVFDLILRESAGTPPDMKHFQALMAPSGEKTYSIRLEGVGRILLILNDAAENRAVNSRTGEFEEVTWRQLMDACEKLTGCNECAGKGIQERWTELYSEPYPLADMEEKAKVAPEQHADDARTSKTARKEPKVSRAKVSEPKIPSGNAEPEKNMTAEEQIPGQTDIENDFPELMPETAAEKPVSQECGSDAQTEDSAKADEESCTDAAGSINNTPDARKAMMLTLLGEIKEAVTSDYWGTASVKAKKLMELIGEVTDMTVGGRRQTGESIQM